MKKLLLESLHDSKFSVLEKHQLINLTGGDAPTYADLNSATSVGKKKPAQAQGTNDAEEGGDDGRDCID